MEQTDIFTHSVFMLFVVFLWFSSLVLLFVQLEVEMFDCDGPLKQTCAFGLQTGGE